MNAASWHSRVGWGGFLRAATVRFLVALGVHITETLHSWSGGEDKNQQRQPNPDFRLARHLALIFYAQL